MRRLLFLVTTMLLMVQGASAWNGSGTSGDPYLIASPADWETFATSTDEYSDTFFKLTADITVTPSLSTTPRQEIMLHPLHILQVQLSRISGWQVP